MKDFEKSMIRETSIPLPGGGDTHFHPWSDGHGFTVTTRVPGVEEGFHENFRFDQMNLAPSDSQDLRIQK